MQIRIASKAFEWPAKVGLIDLQNVSDLSDFHIVFPFDAWMRSACKDAMACKIGQRLFAKTVKLFMIDNDMIKVQDRSTHFKEMREHLCQNILKEKDE